MSILVRLNNHDEIVYAESTLHETLGYGDPEESYTMTVFGHPKRDNRSYRMRKQGDDDLARNYEFLMGLVECVREMDSTQYIMGIQQLLDIWKNRRKERKRLNDLASK